MVTWPPWCARTGAKQEESPHRQSIRPVAGPSALQQYSTMSQQAEGRWLADLGHRPFAWSCFTAAAWAAAAPKSGCGDGQGSRRRELRDAGSSRQVGYAAHVVYACAAAVCLRATDSQRCAQLSQCSAQLSIGVVYDVVAPHSCIRNPKHADVLLQEGVHAYLWLHRLIQPSSLHWHGAAAAVWLEATGQRRPVGGKAAGAATQVVSAASLLRHVLHAACTGLRAQVFPHHSGVGAKEVQHVCIGEELPVDAVVCCTCSTAQVLLTARPQ
jgi:hypothetical protein